MQLNCNKILMSSSRKTKTVQLVLDLFNTTDNALSVVELVSVFSVEQIQTSADLDFIIECLRSIYFAADTSEFTLFSSKRL